MATMPDTLPTDPADLQQYCLQLLTELSAQQDLVSKLSHQLALLRRYLYGRRSEQLDPAQLLLEFARWVQAQEAEATPPPPPVPAAARTWPHPAARAAAAAAGGAHAAGRALHVRGLRHALGQDRRGNERAA